MSNTYYYPILWLVIILLTVLLFTVNRWLAMTNKKMSDDPVMSVTSSKIMKVLRQSQRTLWGFILFMIGGGIAAMYWDDHTRKMQVQHLRQQYLPIFVKEKVWEAPNPILAETDPNADLIAYGRDLIAHTQDYFGETGTIKPGAINRLNCQSCHLDAGAKPFGNNYFAVASTYPLLRARSGTYETIPKRVNDCFERSLNGEALDTTGREMQAIVAYIQWLGTSVPRGTKPKGSGLVEVPFLSRAASPELGKIVYDGKCASCHGTDGQGLPMPGTARLYPSLWGEGSYNEAAGLYRMSRFAGYVKANMPLGASYTSPQLTDEEAWDVAAFVNSKPRPKHPFLKQDWPKIEKKPFDHPFGPFTDTFPEVQHKYGPFEPIIAFGKNR